VTADTWQPTGCTLALNGAGDHAIHLAGVVELGTPTGAISGVVRLAQTAEAMPFTNSGGAGTFILTVNGTPTGAITFSATPATLIANMQAALNAALGTNSVTVVGTTLANIQIVPDITLTGHITSALTITSGSFTINGSTTAGTTTTSSAAIANSETRVVTGPQTSGTFGRTLNYRKSGNGTITLSLEAEVTGGTSAVTATVKSGATGRTSLTLLPS
jgi:hypothetical protein